MVYVVVSNTAPTAAAPSEGIATVIFCVGVPSINNKQFAFISDIAKGISCTLPSQCACGGFLFTEDRIGMFFICYNCNFIFTVIDIILTIILSLHFVIIFSTVNIII